MGVEWGEEVEVCGGCFAVECVDGSQFVPWGSSTRRVLSVGCEIWLKVPAGDGVPAVIRRLQDDLLRQSADGRLVELHRAGAELLLERHDVARHAAEAIASSCFFN